ncbi:MAG: phosphoribosyltransferase family protein [Solirubrobacterales bacterium]
MNTTIDRLALHRGDPYALAEWLALPGALRSGHFELLSGLHSDRFLAFSRICEQDRALDLLASWLAPELMPLRPSAVLAPSTAGVGLGRALSRTLGIPLQLASLNTQGRPEAVIGAPALTSKRVLLVNDVLTTGKGLEGLAHLVRESGGEPAAAAWFLSRRAVDIETKLGAPGFCIGEFELPAWDPSDCEACHRGERLELALDIN